MKNILILSLVAVGLAGCETYNRVPYTGGVGEYGFTYDLDSARSPFVDTSYRPLSPYELAAPIIVVVTNQPPERYSIEERPFTNPRYFGQTPGGTTSVAPSTVIVESAGSSANQNTGAPSGPAPSSAATPGFVQGDSVILPGNLNNLGSNTNLAATNITATNITTNLTNITNVTNTNAVGFVTNTNVLGGVTNTNAFAGGTNRVINEAAGTQGQTNQGQTNQQPPTPFQTNRISEPSGASAPTQTNGTSSVPDSSANSQPSTVRPPPPQRPSEPPASAPQNPPAPTTP